MNVNMIEECLEVDAIIKIIFFLLLIILLYIILFYYSK